MKESNSYGLIGWFTKNPVAANLLMLFIIVAGAISAFTISKDMFPRTDRNIVQVSAVYPGAAPVEVEKGVILPIESALQGLSGIKEMRSKASRDLANILSWILSQAKILTRSWLELKTELVAS